MEGKRIEHIGSQVLILGDSLEVLPTLAAGSVDLRLPPKMHVITEYEEDRVAYGVSFVGCNPTADQYIAMPDFDAATHLCHIVNAALQPPCKCRSCPVLTLLGDARGPA